MARLGRIPWGAAALLVACAVQVLVFWANREVRPRWDVLEPPPSADALGAIALGESQALYRVLGLQLQNAGDTGGRTTPLMSYDYGAVEGWLDRLDGLDPKAAFVPALAAFYFGQSQSGEDVRRMVGFLRRAVQTDPAGRWRYLAHAAYLAKHRLKDAALALETARELAALPVPSMPSWTRQMPAFVLADLGEAETARALVEALLASDLDMPPEEARFLEWFLATRLAPAESDPSG